MEEVLGLAGLFTIAMRTEHPCARWLEKQGQVMVCK